jgi:hypothetical protein
LKVTTFVFILAMLTAGSVVAQETSAFSPPTSTMAEAGFNLNYGNDQLAKRIVDERIIDRYVTFEPSDDGASGRYSLSLDLENEDSDWSFEVSVTMEF